MVRAIVMLKFEEMDPPADWFANQLYETAVRSELVPKAPATG